MEAEEVLTEVVELLNGKNRPCAYSLEQMEENLKVAEEIFVKEHTYHNQKYASNMDYIIHWLRSAIEDFVNNVGTAQ